MNTYELVTVIPGAASPQKKKAAADTIEKLVKVNKGKIVNVSDWGKIDFAFQLAKNDSGIFTLFDIELEAIGAKAIHTRMRAEDEFIRYLLVKKEIKSKKLEKTIKSKSKKS